MTVNNLKGTNERGRLITYTVHDPATGLELFHYQAKRFSAQATIREASSRKIMLPVEVRWMTANRWGFNTQHRTVNV
jgi:hypothetical protein